MTPPALNEPLARTGLRPRRRLLWGALLLLVMALLGALAYLAAAFEEARDQDALETDAQALASDIRSSLLRNVQTLQSLHSTAPTPGSWPTPAAEVLTQHREIVRLEWRDNRGQLQVHRDTPYLPDLFGSLQRTEALPDVRLACDLASRSSGPAYSGSYFWPMNAGLGLELMEMCLPVVRNGQPEGFIVATYSLPGVLAELANKDLLRGRGLAFVDTDGTRIALHSTVPGTRRTLVSRQLLDLPGNALMLRLEGPRQGGHGPFGLLPNVLTAVVGALSLALLAVLALLGRDMRLRQRAEHGLAQALAFRKAMENSLVTGLRARGMDGRISYVNPAFCQMVGLPAEQLIGTGLPAPWWPPELEDEYQQRQAVRLAGQTLPREGYESVFMRSDGTRFPVLIIEAPLIDAQGLQTGYMSAIIDLSEQRRIEDLSRATQERLQATARLATVGEMASLLSHELNQPLAAIASYASGTLNLLEASATATATAPGPEPSPAPSAAAPEIPVTELRQAMRRISEQADRAGRVIKSVADFVRRRDPVREAVAPAALIEAIHPLLGLQAKKQGIRVQVRLAPDCPDVLCDRTMVEQVLLNLARNGVQAMPPDDPPPASGLRVLSIAVIPAGAWVRFTVTDHGHGLSEAARQQLFTPFFTTKPEGMGLGLSLCRTVVEQHGGTLEHEDAPPQGTTFRFTLPKT